MARLSTPTSPRPRNSTPPALGGGGVPLDHYDPFFDDGEPLEPMQKQESVTLIRMLGMAFELWRNSRSEIQIKCVSDDKKRDVTIRRNTGLSQVPHRWLVQCHGVVVLGDKQMDQVQAEIVRQVQRAKVLDCMIFEQAMWPMAAFDGPTDNEAASEGRP